MYQSALTPTEQRREQYIQDCGENMAASIVDTWLDAFELDAAGKEALKAKLHAALVGLDELDIAQAASQLCGGPDFEEWQTEMEGQI